MTEQTHSSPDDSPPPTPPRAITARGRARSWNERPVRLWLILAVIISATTIWFAFNDISAALLDRRLIYHGTVVQAKVVMIDQYEMTERRFDRKDRHNLTLKYHDLTDRELTAELQSPGGEQGFFGVGQMIDLRVDPNDYSTATLQIEPRSWASALIVVVILAIIAIVMIVMTLVQRLRMLRIWQNGISAEAIVVDSYRSGIAPRSKVVRFTVEGDEDHRIYTTLFPHSAGELETDDAFWIVHNEDNPNNALVAELYE